MCDSEWRRHEPANERMKNEEWSLRNMSDRSQLVHRARPPTPDGGFGKGLLCPAIQKCVIVNGEDMLKRFKSV